MSAARDNRLVDFCFIYIIGGETGALKIGITNHIASRLSALQTSTHQKLYLIEHFRFPTGLAKIIERNVHAALAKNRLRGEWFSVDPVKAMQTIRHVASEADAIWSAKQKQRVAAKAETTELKDAEAKEKLSVISPRVFVVDDPVVSKIPIDDYIGLSEKMQREKKAIQYAKDAPKRALVARLAAGKKRKAEDRVNIAKLERWFNEQKKP